MVAVTAVAVLCQVYLELKLPDYMRIITDQFLVENTDAVVRYGTEMLVCVTFILLLAVLVSYLTAYVSTSVSRNIRHATFEKVLNLPLADASRFSAPSLITRSTNDVLHVQMFLATCIQITFRAPILTVWAILKILDGDPNWAVATLVATVIMVIVMLVSFYYALPKIGRVQWLTDEISKNLRENLSGMRVIRAYNAEELRDGCFQESNQRLLDNNLYVTKVMSFSGPVSQMISDILVLTIYWMGALIITGMNDYDQSLMLFSAMVAYATYAALILQAINGFIGMYRALPKALVSLRRIGEVLDTEDSLEYGNETEGRDEGSVEFRNVSFTYPDAEYPAVSNISFTVRRGETLAVIGPTGSGKSTIVDLLLRYYDPSEGTVLVDGRDVKEYSKEALAGKIACAEQRPAIFAGSIAENINYGSTGDERSSRDIDEAIRISQADFVNDFPEGTEHVVEENGRDLSGGQRQRISIARALCKHTDILIFDDSCSALDFRTEAAFRKELKKAVSDKIVITVAQRIGTVADADHILVLDHGRIVGLGKHNELLAECQLYREIVRSQQEDTA